MHPTVHSQKLFAINFQFSFSINRSRYKATLYIFVVVGWHVSYLKINSAISHRSPFSTCKSGVVVKEYSVALSVKPELQLNSFQFFILLNAAVKVRSIFRCFYLLNAAVEVRSIFRCFNPINTAVEVRSIFRLIFGKKTNMAILHQNTFHLIQ